MEQHRVCSLLCVTGLALLWFFSGVLHDRRTRSFNTSLRARLAMVDNVQSASTPRYFSAFITTLTPSRAKEKLTKS